MTGMMIFNLIAACRWRRSPVAFPLNQATVLVAGVLEARAGVDQARVGMLAQKADAPTSQGRGVFR
jgi:hypothetical protein